ncbi:MAG: selenocysteine-specific translation elongation factor [Thermoanaerobaculia bacterium]|nr:selenocysteine-specific translation elongation factor [Thermoanaerobaculia bacterium]
MPERAIVGTAGHIDHGKTSLIRALTGIDCDRWAEEKERGITIDLGFAHLSEGDLQIGFVDVPGHERFVPNALAGLGGIGVVLLVVAADEGVKPQTREHLDVCSLLEVPASLVAVTKADLVAPDLVELARLEVGELLEGTPLAGSPVVAVSSVTGQGLPELRRELVELARRHAAAPDGDQPPRLPLDRAFHLRGLGVVVTGTLAAGPIGEGDTLHVSPVGAAARVRGVQVHGESRPVAWAGERTALQLTGVSLEELARGHQLVAPGGYRDTTCLLVRFRLLPGAPKPIAGHVPIRFHLLSSEVHGRLRPLTGPVEPGDEGIAEVRLAAPVAAARGDRWVARRPSPAATLGGGRVLDPRWPRHRGGALARALEGLAGDDAEALRWWVEEAGEGGLDHADLARRLGLTEAAAESWMKTLAAEGRALGVPAGRGHGRLWLAPQAVRRVAERAPKVLEEYFRADRLAGGMPKAEAVERILPGRASRLAPIYLEWLAAEKRIVVEGDKLDLPDRGPRLTGEESELARTVTERYRRGALDPPSPAEVARELGAKPQIVEGVIRYLVERGRLARLPGGLLIAAETVEEVARELGATGWERFTVPQFKERFGLTRKWAIPLLEHLDSTGVTRRAGDERLLLRR